MAMPPPDPIYLIRGDMGPIHSLAFHCSSEKEHLFAGTAGGNVHIWDLAQNRQLCQLSVGNDPCLALYPFNNNMLTQQKCGIVNLYAAAESQWTLSKTFDTNYCTFCRCQQLTDDNIAVPLNNSKIGILSLKSLSLEFELDPSKLSCFNKMGEIMAIKHLGNLAQLIIAAFEGGQLVLWDITKKEILSILNIEPCPMAIEFDSILMRGIIGNASDQLEIFELSENHKLSSICKLSLKNSGTAVIVSRPDAKIFSVGGWDGLIRIFSWKRLRQLAVLDIHKDTIYDIAYSPRRLDAYDGKQIMAVSSKDGYVSLWDIYS